MFQKVRPILKNLDKKLSDDILKPSKIKLEVFLNWSLKNGIKTENWLAWHNFFHLGGGGGGGGGRGGMAQNHFSILIPFLKIQFKNTSNLILLGFKKPFESFFHKFFKTDLTFWNTYPRNTVFPHIVSSLEYTQYLSIRNGHIRNNPLILDL